TLQIAAAVAAAILAVVWFASAGSRTPAPVELSEAEPGNADDPDAGKDAAADADDASAAAGPSRSEDIAVSFGTPGAKAGQSQANSKVLNAARPPAPIQSAADQSA